MLVLFAYSAHLATVRMYQVDEAQNIYMAKVIGAGETDVFFTNAALWLIGPMAWISSGLSASAEVFLVARLLFLALFWGNILLLARLAGGSFRKPRGLLALLGAASLAPLWDFGFEIRHDNLILCGLLLTWWLGRSWPAGKASYFLAGMLCALMPFAAFKAAVYAVPVFALLLLLPSPGPLGRRWMAAASLVAGAAVALLLVRGLYAALGLWDVFMSGFSGGIASSASGRQFSGWMNLRQIWVQCPLLTVVCCAAVGGGVVRMILHRRKAFTWEGPAMELFLLLVAGAAFWANPAPYPYNLVNLVPFMFLLGFRWLDSLLTGRKITFITGCLAAILLIAGHLFPFSKAIVRILQWPNDRQVALMAAAEGFAGPGQRVYDAIGMVPTRPSICHHWYLHSMNMRAFLDGTLPRVPELIEANPPVVIIRSYRTDWLPWEDQAAISTRYMALADDFLVLGKRLPYGGGNFEALVPGRYQLVIPDDNPAGRRVMLDGKPAPGTVLDLRKGWHNIEGPPGISIDVVWLGPVFQTLPDLGPGDHLSLFLRWF